MVSRSLDKIIQNGGKPLLVIVGPTSVGKTSLSLQLASKFNGEIISADSRLFYQGLDIGTDKPSAFDRSRVAHHMVDINRPDETITLGQYKRLVNDTIADIQHREKLPLLVGGTGQYVWAIIEGWGIPEVSPQLPLRHALSKLGGQELYRWLKYLDPVAAARMDKRNVRRVIRALEVTLVTGRPISEQQRKSPTGLNVNVVGLTCSRDALYRRIDARIERMMLGGLLEEVIDLRQAGYDLRLPSMSGLGYRQLWSYLEGELSLDDAVERIKFESHRFARQQYTWFRLNDSRINWNDVLNKGWETEVENNVKSWLHDKV